MELGANQKQEGREKKSRGLKNSFWSTLKTPLNTFEKRFAVRQVEMEQNGRDIRADAARPLWPGILTGTLGY